MFHAKNGQLKLEETSVDYIRFGTGEKYLILIPGVGDGLRTVRGSALPFSFLYRMFAKEYTVFAFSRKNNLPETYTTEQMADDLSQCMDQLQIPKADLVGVSQGGMIALHLALRYPQKVGKLVLVVTLARQNPIIHNEVTKLETSTRAMTLVSGTGFTMEGYPARSLFSFQFAGLNEVGLPVVVNTEGKLSSSSFNFQDSNENNLKTNLVYSGPVDPTDLGSFGNTFQYKGWRLNVFMTYSFGNVVRLNPVFSSIYSDLDAMPREFKNRWMVSGDEAVTNIPAIASKRQRQLNSSISYGYSAYNYSTARIAKGDFIRMKEISLSYDFPKRLISKLRFSSLSLKLQATNLFLIYADKKLNGQDPEFYNTGGVAAPVPRQFTLTIRIGL